MRTPAHLYFHSPCFDGITSAVLAWDFLEINQDWTLEELHCVNYDLRANWLSTELQTPCAAVDFLYHPQAQFWADHHLTTFLTEEAESDYERRKSSWLIYDSRSGSCASLLWSHLLESFNYRNPRYEEMVEWAEKIDSARYTSVNEAIFGDAPALRINSSLALKNGKIYSETLVKALRYETLEQVSQLPEVRMRFEQSRAMIEAGMDRFAKGSKVEDGIVVFDVDSSGVIVNRYAPYFFFPDARYSAGIVRSARGATITAMRNPWREFPSVFLGRIFEKFGGGGHQRVGALLLTGDRVKEADFILEHILKEIRKENAIQVRA